MVTDLLSDAVERARRELVLARFVGKLAVDHAVSEIRARLDGLPAPDHPDRSQERSPEGLSPRGDASSLALADYDELPAADIVALLAGLDPAERAAIGAYERAGRARRTILGKLDQLDDPA
jgi:hypothetical protein